MIKSFLTTTSLAVMLGLSSTAHAQTVFSENFESPSVAGDSIGEFGGTFKRGALPDNGQWIGSSKGFRSDRFGLINKIFGDFTSSASNHQGIYLCSSNAGLTTSTSAISTTVTNNMVYAVEFDVARDNGRPLSNYKMELVAFAASQGDSVRFDATGTRPGVVLASAVGTVDTNDLTHHVKFLFKADPVTDAAQLGKNIGLRFIGYNSGTILDNVKLSVWPDTDGDMLSDDWEITHFGDLSHDGSVDSDGDKLTDAFEFELGYNPVNPDTDGDGDFDWIGLPGYLTVEEWVNIPGSSLNDLVTSPAFYNQPTYFYFQSQAKSNTNVDDNYGIRMRGTIKAPATGQYQFWIAGNGESVLYLSEDETPFKRQKIASVPFSSGEKVWTQSPMQQSAPVNLIKGQEYFIEILMKAGIGEDHLAAAWQYPGQARQIIPGPVFRSFTPHAEDVDGDGMLDSWEVQFGLDPTDNGLTDINQSGYLDVDGDGLLSFEEYYYEGDPTQVGGHQNRLEFDVWKGILGSSIQDLVKSPKYSQTPDIRSWTGAGLQTWGSEYGGRLRGTITPQASGEYNFYISGDDSAELWLSNDSERFGKQRIAWTPQKTNYQQWEKYDTQRSEAVQLNGSQSYYIEALVKNSGGTDHLSIGWSKLNSATPTWNTADIGLVAPAAWTENVDSVSVSAMGGEISEWSSADTFAFRYVELTGNAVITARVASIDALDESATVGLMIRSDLQPGSMSVAALRTGDGSFLHLLRNRTGRGSQSSYGTAPGDANKWLRIARAGDYMYVSGSVDGVVWEQFAKSRVVLGDSAYFGIAVAGADTAQVNAVLDQISIQTATPVELLPSSLLESIRPNANDVDDDNLPDDWEVQFGLDATTAANDMGQYGDPDGDGVNNYFEYRYGGDPLKYKGVPRNLTREIWEKHPARSVHAFVRSPEFQQGPDRVELLGASDYQTKEENRGYGQRVRGGIVAPVSGQYRFWISGSKDFELWLSSDDTKFNKRKIASSFQWNDGLDNHSVTYRDWDRYGSQASKSIYLEAGEQYFIEILHKDVLGNGHFSVAWSYTDEVTAAVTPRKLIPSGNLRTYAADARDADGDYLPDTWETTYGLNPSDNGITDVREGEYGDYDGDLLSNHQEWLLGTDPTNADTDGDGFDDYREITFYRSDPTVVDLGAPTLVQQVNLSTFTQSSGDWYAQADGSVTSTVRRGYVTYTLNVTDAGVHLLEIAGRATGSIGSVVKMPLVLSIDGLELGSYSLRSVDGGQGLVELLTPWLTVGTHTIKVLSDNHVAYQRLRIDSLRLLKPAGTDANSDGVPDWVATQLINGNGLTIAPTESLVSPAFFEGKARFVEQLNMTSDGQPVEIIRGIDDGWYANVSLEPVLSSLSTLTRPRYDPIADKALNVSFEGGYLGLQQSVIWKETDVITAGDLTIRKGDSLRLTGLPAFQTNSSNSIRVTLTIDGVLIDSNFKASEPHTYKFDTVGEHIVDVLCTHGSNQATGSITVTVKAADFGAPLHILAGTSRTWTTPGVGPDIHVEADSNIGFYEVASSANGDRQFRVDPGSSDEKRVIARTEEGGSIIGFGKVFGYRVFRTDTTGDTQIIQTFPNGDRIVMMSIVAPNLPPGGYIRLKIFAAGVTFLDGTIEKILTASDLDANGIAYVKFNFPEEHNGSICHSLTMLDGDGNAIGQH